MAVVLCPQCRKQASVPAGAEGKRVACPHCQQAFVIPGKVPIAKPVAATASTRQAAVPQPLAPRSKPQPKPKTKRWPWFVGGGGGLALGLLIALLIAKPWKTDPAKPTAWAPEKKFVTPTEKPKLPVHPPAKKDKETPPEPKPPVPKDDPVELKGPADATTLASVVARINEQRTKAGLKTVSLDPELSKGCQAHAQYLVRNVDHSMLKGAAGIQSEDSALPGFSKEGREVADISIVAFAEPSKAFDLWFGRLFSRPPLLHPDLRRLGLGAAENTRGDWVCVLDPTRGMGHESIAFPGPGAKDVPLSFSGGPEVPGRDLSAGFPISLQFPFGKKLTQVNAVLTDEVGNRIPTYNSTPEQPLTGVQRPGLIGMIPMQPLQPKTTYKARVSLQLDGQPFDKAWDFQTEDDSDEAGVWTGQMVKRINVVRKLAGLNPVTLDVDISRGCRAHARYLVRNIRHPATQGLGAHQEDSKLPGYSVEGHKAGKSSVIALGDYEPIDSLDGWMATLYHRIPILEPLLKKVGFGCARGERLGWITVLDLTSGRDQGARPRPILYPVDGQIEVPLIFPPGGEEPNPIPEDTTGRAGYPITAFFPTQAPLSKAQATLEDSAGTPVSCWFSSPEVLANPKFKFHQGTTVCLIPKEPLKAKQTYKVSMNGILGGQAWKKTWTFTTGAAGLSSEEATKLFLTRFNKARFGAGLNPVQFDPEACLACQKHAEYLVRNAIPRGKSGFLPVNEEDPKLPGYSLEGQQAGRRSDVFIQAPSPAVQVDDLLGTLHRRGFMLDPRLSRLGIGCSLEIGRGWFNVLDLNTGRDEGTLVLSPAPGQEQVPIEGRDRIPNEATKVSGYPILAWFPGRSSVRNARATLAASTGTTIDIWLSSPDSPFEPGFPQPNLIGIHPRRPLRAGQIYTVNLQAEVDGRDWRQSWRFSTAE